MDDIWDMESRCREVMKQRKCCILSGKGNRKLEWKLHRRSNVGKGSKYLLSTERIYHIHVWNALPNNELRPSPWRWLQAFMLSEDSSPSSCRALPCPAGPEAQTLFSGSIGGSCGNCPDVLNSALKQHSRGP